MKPAFAGLADWRAKPAVPGVKSYAVEVRWKVVAPQLGQVDWSSIDAHVAEASAAGMHLKLRLMGGVYAPDWVKAQAGTWQDTMEWAGTTNSQPVPRWWLPTYQGLVRHWVGAAAARYDAHPAVAEVSMCGCETYYPEEFLRELQTAANRRALIAAGFTAAQDVAALHGMVDHAKATWRQTRVALACNPYQRLNVDGTYDWMDVTTAKQLIDYFRGVFGGQGVLENDSIMWGGSPRVTQPAYAALYTYLARKGKPVMFQTARDRIYQQQGATHAEYVATLDFAVEHGAEAVELWESWATPGATGCLTAAEIKKYDALLRRNAA